MDTKTALTDDELCERLNIDRRTLQRHLKYGPPRVRYPNAGDVRLIERQQVGQKRLWSKDSVDAFLRGELTADA